MGNNNTFIDYLSYHNQDSNKSLADRVLELSRKCDDLQAINAALHAENKRMRDVLYAIANQTNADLTYAEAYWIMRETAGSAIKTGDSSDNNKNSQ